MKLAASYNYFNGEEHFIASLLSIRDCVDFVSVVWQEESNSGEIITETARAVLEDAISKSLIDNVQLYQPNLNIPRKQNERNKRRLGLDLARELGASHFLSLDTDEFYRPEEFEEAKRQIIQHGWKSTSVSSYMHVKRPIYRTLDTTNCCFITEIQKDTDIGVQDFPCERVDSTRRMTSCHSSHHHFSVDVVAMYHMNAVRRDLSQKLRNSSTTDLNFLSDVQTSIESWSPGSPFFFPKKGELMIDEVVNEFNTYDPFECQSAAVITGKREKWLLATHHLLDYSGSEVVTLEMSEELQRRGVEVSVFAQVTNPQFLNSSVKRDVQIILDPSDINLRDFDVVYCQHQTASQFMYDQDIDFLTSASRPIFVFNHLSPYEPFEAPGPFIEQIFADIIMCNSRETQDALARFGARFEGAEIFQNPSPPSFEITRSVPRADLTSIISISNHLPAELSEAFELLQNEGLHVTQVGRRSGQKRIGVNDLTGHNAVVTIGKTVQQAFRAKVPVFCYDHFGGPGWLTAENIQSAEGYNFSGRCCSQKRSAQQLVKELREGFSSAFVFEEVPQRFCLEKAVDALMEKCHSIKNSREGLEIKHDVLKANLELERSIYFLVDREYKKAKSVSAWKARVAELKELNAKLERDAPARIKLGNRLNKLRMKIERVLGGL